MSRLKIIAVLDSVIAAGGGFNQALNAILQMQRICAKKYRFEVMTSHRENVAVLAKLGISATEFHYTFLDSLMEHFRLSMWWMSLQARLKLVSPFEKKLLGRECNLVYFVAPFEKSAILQRLNYISTVWDVCHRDAPEFPEIKKNDAFFRRERHLKNFLTSAVAVIVDADHSVATISERYGIDRSKLQPMPFGPSPIISEEYSAPLSLVLKKYDLKSGYFFYPAQLWAHKNHLRILQALSLLRQQGKEFYVVFAGGDQGNRKYIEREIVRFGLDDQVRVLGFVPSSDMRALFEGARAVIMPSYFGPTNIPPLEAWTMKKPLIYTSWFSEQTKDAAIYIDPDDAESLAVAMLSCEDEVYCRNLIVKGTERLEQIASTRAVCEQQLGARISNFARRFECWQHLS